MKIIEPGHRYKMEVLDGVTFEQQDISFVKRFEGEKNHSGTVNQEVLRVLIDRIKYMNKQLSWEGNTKILFHLRMALILHETEALIHKVEKEKLNPEEVQFCSKDSHFILTF